MGPYEVRLSRKTVPGIGAQAQLQRIVVRSSRRFLLVHIEEIGERGSRYAIARDRAIGKSEPAAARRNVSRGNRRLARLVDVTEAKQLGSFGPHISDLGNYLAADLPLNVEVPVLHVGCANVRVHSE